jgi:hypothetical protein
MDIKKSVTFLPHHTQLYIGREADTIAYVYSMLQKKMCTTACDTCHICQQIKTHQHPAVTWLSPERWYTKETLQPLFQRISFALDTKDAYFFVLQKADALLHHAANSLLKSLEEPPPGYFFILLAECEQRILPTIRSRCVAQHVTMPKTTIDVGHPLLEIFTAKKPSTASAFLALLEKTNPNEIETGELLQTLLLWWQNKMKYALTHQRSAPVPQHCITLLNKIVSRPIPMGSSKMVWRQLYLVVKTQP